MKDVRWWKFGFVRYIAIMVIVGAAKGVLVNLQRGTLLTTMNFSGPTSLILLLVGIALFVLGYRTQRDDEKLHDLTDSR